MSKYIEYKYYVPRCVRCLALPGPNLTQIVERLIDKRPELWPWMETSVRVQRQIYFSLSFSLSLSLSLSFSFPLRLPCAPRSRLVFRRRFSARYVRALTSRKRRRFAAPSRAINISANGGSHDYNQRGWLPRRWRRRERERERRSPPPARDIYIHVRDGCMNTLIRWHVRVGVHVCICRYPMMVSTLRPVGEAKWGRCQATEAAAAREFIVLRSLVLSLLRVSHRASSS